MKNKTPVYLIHDPVARYLDGFDGTAYEWTPSRECAMGFPDERKAERTLANVRKQFPNAVIVTR